MALVGNPNTGKTTLFNRLSGLRHKTGNFPGTTQEARTGAIEASDDCAGMILVDLPGVYSLELDQSEAEICRDVLAGKLGVAGLTATDPSVVCVVADATNLPRSLTLVGEVMRRRLPTVVAINMIDLAAREGITVDGEALGRELGCDVLLVSARQGTNIDAVPAALAQARIPNHTPPGTVDGLEAWADRMFTKVATIQPRKHGIGKSLHSFTDTVDRIVMHPLAGPVVLAGVMALLFWSIFSLARYPMDWIDAIFSFSREWLAAKLPAGILSDLLVQGVVAGVGATVIFLPQIALLFFLISLLEDTGYLARAAMMMDRVLRPFGLPGHAFIPLLSSHACALPGIMATRAIPGRAERLATILVAPFMTCSARLPVYVLIASLLFRDRPFMAALAFVGCYALGIVAGLVSAFIARRTILPGAGRAMALELPTYKRPSFRTAALTTFDRSWLFVKNAGTNILAICVVLWWLGSYPRVDPPLAVKEMQAHAATLTEGEERNAIEEQATHQQARYAKEHSYIGRLGRAIEPVMRPLGYDWQLSVGVLSSFAAREVFVSAMAVVTSGEEDAEDPSVRERVASAVRTDGRPVFTVGTCWSLLIYYVLAMQCLPTLAVTAKESGGVKWAILQLVWMSGLAYIAALIVRQTLLSMGIA